MYLISSTSSYSIERPNIKNLLVYNEPKKLENFDFKNIKNDIVELSNFNNKLIVLNFWATWCAPCREEMPSLDKLARNKLFNNLAVVPINIGREDINKSIGFFNEIKIQNLKIYNDETLLIPKKLSLRGVPTTILVNKNGKEFARILGAVDFEDESFINWLKNYD